MSDVRRAGPEDAAAIARVQSSSWQTTYRGLLDDEALDRMTPESRLPQ